MSNQSPFGDNPAGPGSCYTDHSAVASERRILEYGLACAERAREQVAESRQRISEALSLVSEGVAS